MRKKAALIAIILIFSISVTAFAVGYDCSKRFEVCPMARFSDLSADIWCHEGLDFVISEGYMRGKTENSFAPNGSMTRAMVVTVLYRIADDMQLNVNVAASLPFNDVSQDSWFYNELCWAYKNGIAKGFTDTVFAPNAAVTREQITLFLSRFAGFIGEDSSASGDISCFTDVFNLSSESRKAISWAVGKGILNGYQNGELRPKNIATRAHFAVMLQRWLDDDFCGHYYGVKEVAVSPTCTENGLYEQVCSSCGHVETGVIPAIGHSYGEKKIGSDASCTKTGTYVKVCRNCGDVLLVEEIPMTGHSYTEKIVKAPSCTETGLRQKTCSACGKTVSESIPMTAHNFVNGRCSCGAYEENADLISNLSDGDKIIIYNPVCKVCMGSVTGNNKISCVSVSISGDSLGYAAADGVSVLTAEKSGSGFYFKTSDGKYLATADEGEALFYSSSKNNALWIIDNGRIKNSTAVAGSLPQYIECYAGSFTCYGYSSKNSDNYKMQFYKIK